jgi:uncharacterized protein YjbJ (UPF0337 family)
MNWDRMAGSWTEGKNKVRERWGKLTDEDLRKIAGRREQLVMTLSERYGWPREQAERQIKDFEQTAGDDFEQESTGSQGKQGGTGERSGQSGSGGRSGNMGGQGQSGMSTNRTGQGGQSNQGTQGGRKEEEEETGQQYGQGRKP